MIESIVGGIYVRINDDRAYVTKYWQHKKKRWKISMNKKSDGKYEMYVYNINL